MTTSNLPPADTPATDFNPVDAEVKATPLSTDARLRRDRLRRMGTITFRQPRDANRELVNSDPFPFEQVREA